MSNTHDELYQKLEITRISNTVLSNHTTQTNNGFGYTVGQHVTGCIQILLIYFPWSSKNLIQQIVFHDYAEAVTGDVVGNAKKLYPELKAALDIVEKRVDEKYNIVTNYPITEKEYEILELVDKVELLLWCYEQFLSGCRLPRFLSMLKRVEGTAFEMFDIMKKDCGRFDEVLLRSLLSLEQSVFWLRPEGGY